MGEDLRNFGEGNSQDEETRVSTVSKIVDKAILAARARLGPVLVMPSRSR